MALVIHELVTGRGAFALGPLSLAVEAGEHLWIAGPNGSGKTTLLHSVAGLLPHTGSVALDNQPLAGPLHGRGVSVLLQDLGLWPHWTLRRQCRFVGGSESQLCELADVLGITELLDRKPGQLSGGEAQRGALLRALLTEHRVLLLDEPFAAQHASGRQRIAQIIDGERARGVAVLSVGHHPPEDARHLELLDLVGGPVTRQ